MRLSKNAALSGAKTPFTVQSAYRARVLVAGFTSLDIGSTPISLQAEFATTAQQSRCQSCPCLTKPPF